MRDAALSILARVDAGRAYADILLDRTLRDGGFRDARDRALLTELVLGTLRRRGALDFLLSPHLARSLEKTDALVRNALRLGAYQLLYLRVPQRVAIFETVAAVKNVRGEKPAGLVNAVLRSMVRAGTSTPADQGGPAMNTVALSAPPSLIEALLRSLGEMDARAFLAASLEKPPFAVRANTFRTSRDALADRLAAAGMDPVPCRYASDGLLLEKPGKVHGDPGFRSGEYLVMDEGAQLIAPLLLPREGEEVLDCCAAPGGKATHLSALSSGRARILAADRSGARVRMLKETVARLGATGVATAVHDFSEGPLPGATGKFDKILVDAPCTGMGVIRRNPDAKWRFGPTDPARMASLQRAILRNAWASLARDGRMVYCTCSPLREEDDDVVDWFRRETGAVLLGKEAATVWPGPGNAWTSEGFLRLATHRHGTDYFFAALLRKD